MEEIKVHESTKTLVDNLSVILTPDGFQRYVLGMRDDGQPRAVYDVIKDVMEPRKKKNKKKKKAKKNKKNKKSDSTYSFYVDAKKAKKKKKKHWHI